MLRLSLEPHPSAIDLPLRQGRAIGWFEDALSPLLDQLPAREVHRLAVAIRSAVGIESLVWLTGPPSETVIVKFSSWPEPVTEEWNRIHAELFRDVCESVDRWDAPLT